MIQPSRLLFAVVALIAIGLLFTDVVRAETWSDKTGKFKIEAEYVGIEGKSIVLRKPDGKTLVVPIDRLSPQSREQAKRLYTMAKSGGTSPTPATTSPASALVPSSSPANSRSTNSSASASQLNFTPPTPPSIPPLAAFPENASLQETVDFVRVQLLVGHPEVIWHALPNEVRETIDSDEFLSILRPAINEQAQTGEQIEAVLMKMIEVLVTKKEFVLNSPLMTQVPPPLLPTVQQAYDPAVGLVFELVMLMFDTDSIATNTVTQIWDDHGPRIGGHLQALAKMAPPGMVDQLIDQIVVEQSTDSGGTITVPDSKGGTQSTEMVKYAGRWMPKEFAEEWDANKNDLASKMAAQMDVAKTSNAEAAQQAKMMVGVFVGMANGVLDPMLAATNQQEFDQTLTQLTSMLGMLGGGGVGGGGVGGGGVGGGGVGGGGVGGGGRGRAEITRTFKDGVEVEQ